MDGSNSDNKHKKKEQPRGCSFLTLKTIKRTGKVHSGIMLIFLWFCKYRRKHVLKSECENKMWVAAIFPALRSSLRQSAWHPDLSMRSQISLCPHCICLLYSSFFESPDFCQEPVSTFGGNFNNCLIHDCIIYVMGVMKFLWFDFCSWWLYWVVLLLCFLRNIHKKNPGRSSCLRSIPAFPSCSGIHSRFCCIGRSSVDCWFFCLCTSYYIELFWWATHA